MNRQYFSKKIIFFSFKLIKKKRKKKKKKVRNVEQWVAGHPQEKPGVAAPPPERLMVDPRGTPRVVRPPPIRFGGGGDHP
jgi:hypothetical protein